MRSGVESWEVGRTTASSSPKLLKIPSMTAGCSLLALKDSSSQLQWKVFLVYPGYQITVPMSWKMMNSFKQQVRTLGITQLQPVITAAKYKILHVSRESWFAFPSTCIFKNLIPSLAVRDGDSCTKGGGILQHYQERLFFNQNYFPL